jgi:hypothetical protein
MIPSYDDVQRALLASKPSLLAQLAGVYTFLMYGTIKHGCQDRWGN